MTLNLSVLTPNRIVWDSEVEEIVLSTNSGQIGILPNHAPIATAVDMGNEFRRIGCICIYRSFHFRAYLNYWFSLCMAKGGIGMVLAPEY